MWWGQCMEQFRLSNEIDFLTDPRFPFQRIWQNNNCENDKATAKTSINFEIIFAQKTVPYQERDNSVGGGLVVFRQEDSFELCAYKVRDVHLQILFALIR